MRLHHPRRQWNDFISQGEFEAVFTYRDLLAKDYPQLETADPPAVYLQQGEKFREVVSATDFKELEDIASLVDLLECELRR